MSALGALPVQQRPGYNVSALDVQPRPGYDVSALGMQPGSAASTPQKGLGQRKGFDHQKGYVEMDPVELFRLRCLREAEEKFRKIVEHGG